MGTEGLKKASAITGDFGTRAASLSYQALVRAAVCVCSVLGSC